MFRPWVLVPVDQKKEALETLHLGHQDIVKCRKQANSNLWWPGISRNIQQKSNNAKLVWSIDQIVQNLCCLQSFLTSCEK